MNLEVIILNLNVASILLLCYNNVGDGLFRPLLGELCEIR